MVPPCDVFRRMVGIWWISVRAPVSLIYVKKKKASVFFLPFDSCKSPFL